MSKMKLLRNLVLCGVIGLLVGSGAEEDADERRLATQSVLTNPEVVVHLDRHEVKVGDKVAIRDFVFVEDNIPAPSVFGYRMVRIGFYHRRLKRMVYDNPTGGVVSVWRPKMFSETLPRWIILSHPWYGYFTDERRGHETDFVPIKPGVYLIFAEWDVKHPKWGKGLLQGGPALLIVNPPHCCHSDDTTDPRFCSSGILESQDELEDRYDRKSQSWREHQNQWKR